MDIFLGQNIKYLRKSRGISQEDLSKVLDRTYSAVGGYEIGKSVPPLEIILKICEFFQVRIQDLLFKNLETGQIAFEPQITYANTREDTYLRVIDRLEKELKQLETLIVNEAPELAKKLGLK